MENSNQPSTTNVPGPTPVNEVMSPEMAKKIAMLRHQSGEGLKGLGFKFINFDGKEGHFFENKKDDKGEPTKVDLGVTFAGIILVSRTRLSCFAKEGLNKIKYSSKEFDSNNEQIEMLRDGKPYAKGSYIQLKEKFPDFVGMEKVLYVRVEGKDEVVKLTIKGTSLMAYFEYLKTFPPDDSSARYTTQMTVEDYKSDFGTNKVIKFTKGAMQDLNYCFDMVDALRKAIQSTEMFKTELVDGPSNQKSIYSATSTPVNPEDESINVDDLPF